MYGSGGVETLEGPINCIDSTEGCWGPVVVGEFLYIEVIQDFDDFRTPCPTYASHTNQPQGDLFACHDVTPPDLIVDKISHDFRHIFSDGFLDPELYKFLKEESCHIDVTCNSE